jgi:hypothetical protein
MAGWNPWMVLCVSEDAPYPEVQRSFRRMVKTTHPDGGGDARAFDAVVRAFADIRRTLPQPSAELRSTPYDTWLRPGDRGRSWIDDESGYGIVSETSGRGAAAASPGSDFSAVLLDEMSRLQALVTV